MNSRIITVTLCLIGAALASESALARGGRGGHWNHGGHRHGGVHWGVVIGAPLGWYNPYPYWSNPPPYWYNPPVVVQSAPPVYIEREREPAPASADDDDAYYWYHCARPEGYYPYIKECPGGWKKVMPTPPSD